MVANPLYRSVRTVIQNSTNAMWTLDAAESLCGAWAQHHDPYKDIKQVIPQSAAVIVNESRTLHTGAEGFVRFSSVDGVLHIHWSRPWVGPFEVEADLSDPVFKIDVQLNEDTPAFPVALITVSPRSGRR